MKLKATTVILVVGISCLISFSRWCLVVSVCLNKYISCFISFPTWWFTRTSGTLVGKRIKFGCFYQINIYMCVCVYVSMSMYLHPYTCICIIHMYIHIHTYMC